MTELKENTDGITANQILGEEQTYLEDHPDEMLLSELSLATDFVREGMREDPDGDQTRKQSFGRVAEGIRYRAQIRGDFRKVDQINSFLKKHGFIVLTED